MDTAKTASHASLALEQHYSPAELAARWAVSQKLLRSLFAKEPGVLRVDRPEKRHKRGYCSMRIPESVAIKVHRELCSG